MVRLRSPAPYGGFPERPKGADCKSVVTDFGGPNPPSPTKKAHRLYACVLFCCVMMPRGTLRQIRLRICARVQNPPPTHRLYAYVLFCCVMMPRVTLRQIRLRICAKVQNPPSPQKKDCNFDTKLQSFLTKSAFVGINPLRG